MFESWSASGRVEDKEVHVATYAYYIIGSSYDAYKYYYINIHINIYNYIKHIIYNININININIYLYI